MTGREKIEAALSREGTCEIPVVVPYESIYIRDHWEQLTGYPWWYQYSPKPEHQLQWRFEVMKNIGQDWFMLPLDYPYRREQDRRNISIEVRKEGVYQVDGRTGQETVLTKPEVGGEPIFSEIEAHRAGERPPETIEEIDELIGPDCDTRVDDDKELFSELLKCELYPVCYVSSLLWSTYSLWGFEGLMTNIAAKPELVEYVCKRFLTMRMDEVRRAARLGAAGIWIEDCLTDMINPERFASLNVPFLQQLIEEIRAAGMHSIYYFCGNPTGKWEQIISLGFDALALEESKKNFIINIEDVIEMVQGRCTVLGNLDAIGILQDGTERQLQSEIDRQLDAGRLNGNRFIMSLGSPVTPRTSADRVRRYCNIVHEMGSIARDRKGK